MITTRTYTVTPRLPDALRPIEDLAYNLWWTWNPSAQDLFRSIDPDLWEETRHNPVRLLGGVPPRKLERLARDEHFMHRLQQVHDRLTRYLGYQTWYTRTHGDTAVGTIAYFSAEYGLHECLPIYSGGLGVLSGDHLKSAADLGLPLIGVGLLYRHGYFGQRINRDGWQQESYPENDFYTMPIQPVKDDGGRDITVIVDILGRNVEVGVWKASVGRVPLYLLDTNRKANATEDRAITGELYGGDQDTRIRQEIVLGIGGMRALASLGTIPAVCHMNEGHSAFLGLERMRTLMHEHELSFAEAVEIVAASTLFTTHTPVPAGIDSFPPDLVIRYFGSYIEELGISKDEFLNLGRRNETDNTSPFSMAVLALRLSGHANAVSALHGEISRRMWESMWPGVPRSEIPIGHITNGVHTRTWLSDEFERLYDLYLDPTWVENPIDRRPWMRVDRIPDAELWRSKERLRERLIAYARRKLRGQLEHRGAHKNIILQASEVLDPEALTIGFARRFATYKRATLIFRDPDRLHALLSDPHRPVQLLFAGKAHPRDLEGKEFIRTVVKFANEERFRQHIVFLENYDMMVARYMVQGVDVWMNTPRRPMEASGTSGMKVPINGGINMSVLDGWWCEGHNGENGWAIGAGDEFEDFAYQDEVESMALYGLLEDEIVPLFYQRGPDRLPRDWIATMKNSIKSLCPFFNTNRMLEDYTQQYYLPSIFQWNVLTKDDMAEARQLSTWREKVRNEWDNVRVLGVEAAVDQPISMGGDLKVKAMVVLGALSPSDVAVELYHGPADPDGRVIDGRPIRLKPSKARQDDAWVFTGLSPCDFAGRHAFSVRVVPWRPGMAQPLEMGYMTWW
ncbi:alpha-glucan family phosphorylase [Candidatus Fermentibacteria bacterium]|nr:alpha-glucan family phosphorylase [Candidatus Fermentibacteria bacterium]